jgi:hypothetical protein
MNRIRVLAVMAGLVVLGPAPLPAQDTLLTRLLIANRYPLTLEAGRPAGQGGRWLVEQGNGARFFLVGEEHGVGPMPGLVEALLRELRPAGYNTFAIEVSPLQGARLDALARSPNSGAALDSLLASWFTMIPFYSLAEERKLLASAMAPQGALPAMRIWGLDYDISADRMYLRELEKLAPPAGRASVQRARELADSGFAHFVANHDPSRAFAWSAPDSVFAALRAAFGKKPPARAAKIIDVFERTARINRLFLSGRGYESNLDRSAFLRQNFAAELGAAEAAKQRPRVLFKFGGSHMMRGFNYTHTLDIGTAAAVAAEARGERSFGMLVLGGTGTRTARMVITKGQYEPVGTAEIDGANYAWLRPALPESGWVVFDMREVRLAYLSRRGQALTPIQDRFFHAYDAIVVLTGSTPATNVPIQLR